MSAALAQNGQSRSAARQVPAVAPACEIIAMIAPAARITETKQKNNTTKKTSPSAPVERECPTSRYLTYAAFVLLKALLLE